jgi:hypothetical protein
MWDYLGLYLNVPHFERIVKPCFAVFGWALCHNQAMPRKPEAPKPSGTLGEYIAALAAAGTPERQEANATHAVEVLEVQRLLRGAVAEAAKSSRFKRWKVPKPAKPTKPADERHYSPAELGEAWGLSADTIRLLFEQEPDVLIFGDAKGTRSKRRYRTIKIPESVVIRVKKRLGSRAARLR